MGINIKFTLEKMRTFIIAAMLLAQTLAISLEPEFLMGVGTGVYTAFTKGTIESSNCPSIETDEADLDEFNSTYEGVKAMAMMMNQPQLTAIVNIVDPIVYVGESLYSVIFYYGDATESCQGIAVGIELFTLIEDIINNLFGGLFH